MRHLTALCVALALATPAWGGEIKGDREVGAYKLVRLESDIAPATDKEGKPSTRYSWAVEGIDANGKTVECDALKYDNKIVFTGPPGSAWKVKLTVVDFDKRVFDESLAVVKIKSDGPAPGPGPGPGPDPGPKPDPTPTPSDAPIKAPGNRVLIVYSEKGKDKLPAKQQAILTAKGVRDYLNGKCTADPDRSDWKAFRIWPEDTVTTDVHKTWKDAMARPRKGLPWIIISTGTKGYEGPLPDDVDATLALLKKYFGE